jgi:hypothetical protein
LGRGQHGNGPQGRYAYRSADPVVPRSQRGVPVTKPGSTTIEETAALLEDFSQVDRELAIMSGNVDAYRLKQARPHVQGMSNKMATTLFYGNANANPLEFTGFAPRYNTLSTTTNKAAANVINAGGTGSALRSIWLVGWGPDTVFGIYPKNTRGGLDHEDATNASASGEHGFPPAATVLTDASGNCTWAIAITGSGVAACSSRIGATSFASRTSIRPRSRSIRRPGPNLEDLMVQAIEQIESTTGVRAVFYVPRASSAPGCVVRWFNKKKPVPVANDEVGGQKHPASPMFRCVAPTR